MNKKDYNNFLNEKLDYGANSGFEPTFMPDSLFDFQEYLTNWIIKKGRGAIFADCGAGKTLMELVTAQNIVEHTNKSAIILTPLAVSYQMLEEAEKFGIEAHDPIKNPNKKGIHVLNFQKLHYLNREDYGGMLVDESGIIKNSKGKTKDKITEFMRTLPYRSLWTATAAPNDWFELGTSSEALGYYGYQDMIDKFFINNQNSSSSVRGRFINDKFRLKYWAEKGPFWQWVASWAMAMRKPSDLGFEDGDFILPPLNINDFRLIEENVSQGQLFDLPAVRRNEENELMRRTAEQRCRKAAELVADKETSIVWCNRIQEAKLLKKMIPNSIEISGSDGEEKRIETVKWFIKGSGQRVLITKPKIFGFGMNFQHCSHMVYFPTHSYERYYQATRRLWRFGQMQPVTVDRVYTRGFDRIVNNLDRKSANIDTMFNMLVKYMNDAIELKRSKYYEQEISIPKWLM